MEEFIQEKKIVIIGGHPNWVNKLRQKFPGWTFLSPKTSGSVDAKLVQNADMVYFFTDTISHSTYGRFIRIVREQQVPFGYIHGINLEANIAQIYEDMKN